MRSLTSYVSVSWPVPRCFASWHFKLFVFSQIVPSSHVKPLFLWWFSNIILHAALTKTHWLWNRPISTHTRSDVTATEYGRRWWSSPPSLIILHESETSSQISTSSLFIQSCPSLFVFIYVFIIRDDFLFVYRVYSIQFLHIKIDRTCYLREDNFCLSW